MFTFRKRIGVAAVLGVVLLAPAAQAQFRPGYGMAFPAAQNFYPPLVPSQLQQGMLRNWAFNTAVIGNTYGSIPPWVFGYNPYPGMFGGGGGYINPYSPMFGGGYMNPYGYGGGYSAGYGGLGGIGGYAGGYGAGAYPFINPYAFSNPATGYLYGSASVMNAYGQLIQQEAQARLTQEMVLQARLDTKKKKFDTLAYIRDHTPTFTQIQAKIAKSTMERLQTAATQPEIWSGKSLNFLLNALKKYANQKLPVASGSVDEDVIKHLNVAKKYGNLGLLRNNGQFTWPAALQTLVPNDEQANILDRTQRLFRQANASQANPNAIRDLRVEIEQIRDKLTKEVNQIRYREYSEAKRFLNEFDDALTALEDGDVVAYQEFQSKFSNGAASVQDLVSYMEKKGLHFAPATTGDQAAYQALHDALASWSVAIDSNVASNSSSSNSSSNNSKE